MRAHKPQKKARLFFIAIFLIIIALIANYAFGNFFIQSRLISPQDVNTLYPADYSPSSFVGCQNTPLLESSHIKIICTEAFQFAGPNDSALPDSFTIFYQEFDSQQSAKLYIQNITAYLNTTPWAKGVNVSSSAFQNNNLTIYYASIFHNAPRYIARIYTVYLSYNSTVIGVSTVTKNQSNAVASQKVALNLLQLQYKRLIGS